ncbi:MAG: zinc ribbon domain-containing protein [Gammaproteobacteria bacterium]|jgi:putative FmdB family regulatory protein|nr:zinc ribbon domain-containing protein [Gammaproteobacteria bacterium]
MPIYEYQCDRCEHKLQILQKISEEPLKECPECNETALKKLISAASFRLKGGGWYETDFKTGDKKQLAESDSVSTDKVADDKLESKAKNKPDADATKSKNVETSSSKSEKKPSPSSSSKAGKRADSTKKN